MDISVPTLELSLWNGCKAFRIRGKQHLIAVRLGSCIVQIRMQHAAVQHAYVQIPKAEITDNAKADIQQE